MGANADIFGIDILVVHPDDNATDFGMPPRVTSYLSLDNIAASETRKPEYARLRLDGIRRQGVQIGTDNAAVKPMNVNQRRHDVVPLGCGGPPPGEAPPGSDPARESGDQPDT